MIARFSKISSLIFFLLFPVLLFSQSDFTLLSWNIKDFGKTKDAEEITFIAKIIKDYDIAAIQEVVSGYGGAQAVARLADELNRMGGKWDYIVSDPTQLPPYKTERYAFLWKTSKAKLIGRGWLDKEHEALVFREPFLAKFQVKGQTFIIANYHSRTHDDHPGEELKTFYDYPQRFPGYPLIIAGDFNMKSTDKAFKPMYNNGFSTNLHLVETTLKRTCNAKGQYTNHPIDFILYQRRYFENVESGVLDFVDDCDNLTKARAISDHLPVWAKLGIMLP